MLFRSQGGEEIDRVETTGPGTLDFLPNRAGQVKRNLKGDQIWITYGSGNRIDRFRSVNAVTRTEMQPPRITQSKEILAFFDAASVLTRLEQNTDFRYEEGDRRANARKATMEQAPLMLLWPCAALTLTILAMNLLCDALRDWVDPRTSARRPRLRLVDRLIPGLLPPAEPKPETVLDIRGLTVEIETPFGAIKPVEDVSLSVRAEIGRAHV